MRGALRLVCLIALFMSLATDSWSKPPTPSRTQTNTEPEDDASQGQNDTATSHPKAQGAPITVEISKAPVIHVEAAKKTEEGNDGSSPEWWLVYLTAVLAATTAALAWYTASLYRATVALGKEAKTSGAAQTEKMEKSIVVAQTAADAAVESNKLSREMFISSERPWVVVDFVQVKSGLIFNEIGASLDIEFTFKNVGKSPARNVTVEVKLYPMSPLFSDPVGEQNAFVLSTQDNETYVPRARRVLHRTHDETLQRSVFITKPDLDKATSFEDIKFIVPVVIGWVRYEFITDDEFYYTNFMYQVFREPEGIRVGINPVDGSVPEKQLRLVRDLAGCYST